MAAVLRTRCLPYLPRSNTISRSHLIHSTQNGALLRSHTMEMRDCCTHFHSPQLRRYITSYRSFSSTSEKPMTKSNTDQKPTHQNAKNANSIVTVEEGHCPGCGCKFQFEDPHQ